MPIDQNKMQVPQLMVSLPFLLHIKTIYSLFYIAILSYHQSQFVNFAYDLQSMIFAVSVLLGKQTLCNSYKTSDDYCQNGHYFANDKDNIQSISC